MIINRAFLVTDFHRIINYATILRLPHSSQKNREEEPVQLYPPTLNLIFPTTCLDPTFISPIAWPNLSILSDNVVILLDQNVLSQSFSCCDLQCTVTLFYDHMGVQLFQDL